MFLAIQSTYQRKMFYQCDYKLTDQLKLHRRFKSGSRVRIVRNLK